jgi:Uma2 family endonuclease
MGCNGANLVMGINVMVDTTQTRLTAAEFAQLPETNTPTELIDGEVVMTPAPKYVHQKVVLALAKLIEQMGAGGVTCIAPIDVYLDEANVVQPDVLWASGPESRAQLGEDGYWHGAPDLVVAVLSPATARYDRSEKFRLYEKHGTLEYWLVDPEAEYVEVWRREEGGFQRQGVYGPGDAFKSTVLGGKKADLKKIFSA